MTDSDDLVRLESDIQLADSRLAAARFCLTASRPYLSAAVWALDRLPRPGLGTLAVDRYWRLYYDPAAVNRWSIDEVAGVLYHEILHLLRDHADRAGSRNRFDWNCAADAEINDDLESEHVKLPGCPLMPSHLGQKNGGLAEEYFKAIVTEANTPIVGAIGAWGHGDCGSGTTGWREDYEEPPPSRESQSGRTEADARLIRQLVANAIVDYASSHGGSPKHLRDWADNHLNPQVDWRRELASAIRRSMGASAGAADYSYRRPSRRQSCFSNIVFPSLVRPETRLAVVVDTSSSMTTPLLDRALAELRGILRAVGARDGLQVLSVDSTVNSSRKVFSAGQVRLIGGGGTEMGKGISAAARLRPVPDTIVVLTDGDTPWPKRPPAHSRVIAVLLDQGYPTPKWAKVIRVPRELQN